MPMWCPPTPPADDPEVYVDLSLSMLYHTTPLMEGQLPPYFVKRNANKLRTDFNGKLMKLRKTDQLGYLPRSLFDRPTAAIVRLRREIKVSRQKRTLTIPRFGQVQSQKPMVEPPIDHPEWVIDEDWSLLHAVQVLQELPLNLTVISPGHLPNWDLVSEMVNIQSRSHRTSKSCKSRYESCIIAREEGRLLFDINNKRDKLKKNMKSVYRPLKPTKSLKTIQMYEQDDGMTQSAVYISKFDLVKVTIARRSPPLKPMLVDPNKRNAKHLQVLQENGIQFEVPSSPAQLAQARQERIQRDMIRNTVAVTTSSRASKQDTSVTTTAGVVKRPPVLVSSSSQPVVVTTSSIVVKNNDSSVSLQAALHAARLSSDHPRSAVIPVTTTLVAQVSRGTAVVAPAGSDQMAKVKGVTTAQLALLSRQSGSLQRQQIRTTSMTPLQKQQLELLNKQHPQINRLRLQQPLGSGAVTVATSQAGTKVAIATAPLLVNQSPRGQARIGKSGEEMITLIKSNKLQQLVQQLKSNSATIVTSTTMSPPISLQGGFTLSQQKVGTQIKPVLTPQQLHMLQRQQLIKQHQQQVKLQQRGTLVQHLQTKGGTQQIILSQAGQKQGIPITVQIPTKSSPQVQTIQLSSQGQSVLPPISTLTQHKQQSQSSGLSELARAAAAVEAGRIVQRSGQQPTASTSEQAESPAVMQDSAGHLLPTQYIIRQRQPRPPPGN